MNNQINLVEILNTSQILVGLDLGTKTLGVAVSDRYKIIASPLSTIQRNGTKKDLLKLQEILNDYEIGGFIVGLPLSLDNSDNQQTQLVKNFNKELINFLAYLLYYGMKGFLQMLFLKKWESQIWVKIK